MSRVPDSPMHLPPARRTMADITAMFMAGAGPGRPIRMPPRPVIPASPVALAPQSQPPAPSIEQPKSEPSPMNMMPPVPVSEKSAARHDYAPVDAPPTPAPEKVQAFSNSMRALPPVQTALLDHSTAGSYRVLLDAAKLLSLQFNTSVGIIGRDECVLRLSRVQTGADMGIHARVAAGGAPDVQLARELFAMRSTVKHWLIGVPRLGLDLARKMLQSSPDWLLVSATDNDAIIACYRLLKGVCMLPDAREASIRLLLKTTDRAEAGRIHGRLNHVVQEFLHQDLDLMVPSAAQGEARVDAIAEFAIVDHDGDDSDAVWTAVLEFLRELQEIEPDEAELEAALEEEPAGSVINIVEHDTQMMAAVALPVDEPRVDAVAEAAEEPEAVPAVIAEMPAAKDEGPGLRVCESTDAMDVMALREALADLIPDAVFLEARPPHENASLLAADRKGGLHVWLLADSADLTAWGSLWQWAQDHRQLISLTRPDLALKAESPVAMHVILPADAPRAMRMPPAGVTLYRLHHLKWAGKRAMAVVPVG